MRRWGSLLATTFLAATGLVLVGPTTPAYACSCAYSDERQLREVAAFVVEGTVTDVEAVNLDGFSDARVTIVVDRVVKGPVGDRVSVGAQLRTDGASCGYAFTEGLRYRVYAMTPSRPTGVDGLTNLCSGNQELARLPVPTPTPTPPPAVAQPPPPTDDPYPIGPILALAVATAGVIGLAAAVVVRNRRRGA